MLHAQLITSMLSSLDGDAEKNEKAERASNICFCCREDDVATTASRVWERLRDEVSQNRSDRETLATCVGKFAWPRCCLLGFRHRCEKDIIQVE